MSTQPLLNLKVLILNFKKLVAYNSDSIRFKDPYEPNRTNDPYERFQRSSNGFLLKLKTFKFFTLSSHVILKIRCHHVMPKLRQSDAWIKEEGDDYGLQTVTVLAICWFNLQDYLGLPKIERFAVARTSSSLPFCTPSDSTQRSCISWCPVQAHEWSFRRFQFTITRLDRLRPTSTVLLVVRFR